MVGVRVRARARVGVGVRVGVGLRAGVRARAWVRARARVPVEGPDLHLDALRAGARLRVSRARVRARKSARISTLLHLTSG